MPLQSYYCTKEEVLESLIYVLLGTCLRGTELKVPIP